MEKTSHYNQQYFQARDYLDYHLAESIKILMEDNNLKAVLDVGCGTGRLVKFLNEKGFNAVGCDISDLAVKQAKKINKKNDIIKASATNLPFKNHSFDLVVSIFLIEHLTGGETEKFLGETIRILKPHGFIFLITPNFASPARYLLGKKWFAYSDPTHKNFFTPKSLSQLLKKKGFRNIKLRHKTSYNALTDLHLPAFCRKFPRLIKNFLNWLMVSSPLSTFRDSFWILGQK